MFCPKCGRELREGDTFCSSCGTKISGGSGPAGYKAPKFDFGYHFNSFVSSLRNFFSNGYMRGVKTAAESGTFEGIFFAAVYYIAFLIGVPLIMQSAVRSVMTSVLGSTLTSFADEYMGELYGALLLRSLICGLIALVLLVLGVFVYFTVMKVQRRDFLTALNLVTYCSLPVAVGLVASALVGFIWLPLVFVVMFFAFIMQILMIYNGVRAVGRIDRSAVLSFTILCTAVASVIFFFVFGIYLGDIVKSLFGGSASLGSLL